ncbi:hypothetical protein [Aliikangiella sp. IMCC44359]|uniref:hypothetical protein n=1 Tax=Aliikangiella sp. IMCC44359 TaxID=3459125 RepID=UPI00403AED5F
MILPNLAKPIIRNLGIVTGIKASIFPSQQTCWSRRKCKGKVLNHRDRHNCKNSGGKSWNDYQGNCYNNI